MQDGATGADPPAAAGPGPATGPIPPSFGSRGDAMGWGAGCARLPPPQERARLLSLGLQTGRNCGRMPSIARETP